MMKSRLVLVVSIILCCYDYGSCGWMQKSASRAVRMTATTRGGGCTDSDAPPTCEVVGAAGRMASLFLQQEGSIPVSRGVSPGCLSPVGTPIYVATPSKSWRQVYQDTVPSRRNDLVWVGNGLLLPEFINSTIVIPHFGILSVGATPITRLSSPPTLVYGQRHGAKVARVLQDRGIQTRMVASWNDIQIHAAQKLLWASCMWLLCHSCEPPLTVQQVHDERQEELTRLVTELLPALESIVGTNVDLSETLTYLEAYSRSMPGTIPSKELAIEEVKERNGVWLKNTRFHQAFHKELLESVAGAKVLQQATTETMSSSSSTTNRQCVRLEEIDLTVWGCKGSSSKECRSAVMIGGGIIGSSVALNLARQGVNVTVLDRLPETEMGATTPASWAWINANNKAPPAYQWLNQLGMRSWRRDVVVRDLPVWNGALVQYKQDPHFLGGYAVEGPLSRHRIQELEQHSNFTQSDGPIYFFADEGSVDPAAAVRSMRQAAKELGVRFMAGQNVTTLVRNEEGDITGVESCSTTTSSPADPITIRADVVVVAAGIGSASPVLGGLPLTHSPGQITFAKSSSLSLKRILVDTVRESHVLQRRDGTLVAGGGFLEVGGEPSSSWSKGALQKQTADRGSELLTVAAQLAPEPVACSEFINTAQAVRPMPRDGWPAVGYLEPGLYTVVTHSGVTLSPILGPLAATEIAHGLDLDILQPFRPARLF